MKTAEFFEHKVSNVADLIPYALNSRTHSDEQIAELAASIRLFGFTNPVLVDEKNNLIAGHGRLLAARKLKMDQVPSIVVAGLDDRRRRALVIADNKLALNAEWDVEALGLEIGDLGDEFGRLMGFSQDELIQILRDDQSPNFDPGLESEQGKLDQLEPKIVKCPHCQIEWDLREHGQG